MTKTPAPLSITSKAAKAIQQVIQDQNVPANYQLRVGMQGGGCGGMSFLLGFDEPKENDLSYKVDGLDVIIDKSHSMYVLGMEIDWHEDDQQKGFVFNNPQKKKSKEATST